MHDCVVLLATVISRWPTFFSFDITPETLNLYKFKKTEHPVSSNHQMSLFRQQNTPPPELTVSVPLLYSSTSSSRSSSEAEDTDSPGNSQRFDLVDVKYKIPAFPNHGNKSFRPLAVLSGHVGSVSSLALCGEFILSASQGKDIIVWQQPDLRMFTKFGQGDGSVKAVVTVGNKVFSAHQDSRIRVWKVSRRSENVFRLLDTLPTKKDYLGKFMKQSNYVQTRRHHKKLWIEHSDSISCLAVSISNGLIYSGSWDKTLKVWRISDLKCLESIKAHDDAINALVSCKGVLYSASADGKIKAWGKTEEKQSISHSLKGILSGHEGVSVNAVVVSDDGKWVYGGGSDGFVMSWEGNRELVSWKLVSEKKAHDMAVLCLSVVGEFLCSGSADKSIGVWKREAFGRVSKVGSISGHEGPVKCLQASPVAVGDGFMLYSGSLDKSLRVWWVPKNYSSMGEEQDTDSVRSTTKEASFLC